MKSAIIQILSGILIIILLIIFIQFVEPGYHNGIVLDKDGNVVGMSMGLQIRNIPLEIWTFSYAILGLAVFVCGVIQFIFTWRKTVSTTLTIIRISLGVLVIGSVIFFLVKAEPPYTLYARILEGSSRFSIIQKDPGWIFHQLLWKESAFIPGLIVVGCGIADLIKMNKTKRRELKEIVHAADI